MPVDPGRPNQANNFAQKPAIPYPRHMELVEGISEEGVRQSEDNWGEFLRWQEYMQKRGYVGSGGLYAGTSATTGAVNNVPPGTNLGLTFSVDNESAYQYADTTLTLPGRSRVVLLICEVTFEALAPGGVMDFTYNGRQVRDSLCAAGDFISQSFVKAVPMDATASIPITYNAGSTVNCNFTRSIFYIY